MRYLFAALKSQFDQYLTQSIPGGYHRERPGVNATKPYLVVTTPGLGGGSVYDTSSPQTDRINIHLELYAADDETADALLETVVATFNPPKGTNKPFQLGKGNLILVESQGMQVSEELQRDPQAERVWMGVADIQYTVQWTPGA